MSLGTTAYRDARADLVAGAILLFFLCVSGLVLWFQKAALLNYAYPGVVLALGGWLYISRPVLYLGFTWWVWFITPFVRRVIDYQVGYFNPISPVMLSPYLITGLAFFTILRFGKLLKRRMYFPFLLSMLGVTYGYLVGAVKVGMLSATYGLLQWLIPLFLGFHVLVFWQEYPQHRRIVQATFTWGVLLMGLYGLAQYIYPPDWDMYWLVSSGQTVSIGRPEAFGFRVFSTVNSAGTFAAIMMVGLLLLFDGRGYITLIAAVVGYLSFLLTLVRSAWLAWLTGIVVLILLLKGQMQRRLIGVLALAILIGVPLILYTPDAESIRSRFETFSQLEEDISIDARLRLHRGGFYRVLMDPIGMGIGSTGTAAKLSIGKVISMDSGVVGIPLVLGWPGAIMFLGGLVWMLRMVLQNQVWRTDRIAVIALAIVMTQIFLLLSVNALTGHGGCIAWSFLGLVLAAQAYYEEEK